MAVVRNIMARLGIETSQFEKGVDKAKKKHESLVERLNKSVGESSAMKKWTEILTGAGAAAGVYLIARGLEQATKQAVELNNQFRKGELSIAEYRLGIAKTIPLVGSLVGAFENINELMTGAKFEKEQTKLAEAAIRNIKELFMSPQDRFISQAEKQIEEAKKTFNPLFDEGKYLARNEGIDLSARGRGGGGRYISERDMATFQEERLMGDLGFANPKFRQLTHGMEQALTDLDYYKKNFGPVNDYLKNIKAQIDMMKTESEAEKELIKLRAQGWKETEIAKVKEALFTRERIKNAKLWEEFETSRTKAMADGIQKVNDALDKALKKDKPESWDYLAGLRRELQDLEDQAKGWTPEQIKLNNMRSRMTAAQQREAETLLERIMNFTRKATGADRWNSIYGSTPGAIVPLPGGQITQTRSEKELIEQTKILKEIKREKAGFGK